MKILLPLMILIFSALHVFGQADLPDKGTLSDIKGKTKVYLIADAINLKLLDAEIRKQKTISVASRSEDAEFFAEFKPTEETQYVSTLRIPLETGQLDVFYYRDKKKVIVWSKGDSSSSKPLARKLFARFLKDFKKT